MLTTLKNGIHRLKEGLRLPFYTRTQRYDMTYRVILKNTDLNPWEGALLIPLPLNTKNQTLLSEPVFSPVSIHLGSDSVFGNRYATWNVDLAPNQSMVFEQTFAVRVLPAPFAVSVPLREGEYIGFARALQQKAGSTNPHVAWSDPRVKALATQIKADSSSVYQTVQRLNRYVVEHLQYGDPIPGLYSCQDAMSRPCVDCGGFDSLLVSLCMALDIPARIVAGFWAGYPTNEMHAWAEVLLPNGQWLSVDPSVEHLFRAGRTRKSGRFGFVGSDRIAFSVGTPVSVLIQDESETLDILQTPVLGSSSSKPLPGMAFEFITAFR